MGGLRVVVVDDAPLIREGVQSMLRAGGCEIVGEAGDTEGLVALLETGVADVVVLDIRMPPSHSDEGLKVLEALRGRGSTVGVLLLSMHVSPALAARAMAAGPGTGYLLKERVRDASTLTAAVRAVASGGAVLDPEIVSLLMRSPGQGTRLSSLTGRERQVLELVSQGKSNGAIVEALHISPKTLEAHLTHVFAKLGLVDDGGHRRVLAVLEFLRFIH